MLEKDEEDGEINLMNCPCIMKFYYKQRKLKILEDDLEGIHYCSNKNCSSVCCDSCFCANPIGSYKCPFNCENGEMYHLAKKVRIFTF